MRGRAAVLLIVSGCALFPELDGLVGDAGGPVDATLDAPGEAAAEASSDAAPSDVVQPPDGNADADAGAVADADAAIAFCASHTGHTFCEDFDEPSFANRWSSLALSVGATLDESDASAQSPPNQLLGDVTFPPSSSTATAYVSKHFTSSSKITAEADFEVDSTLAKVDPIHITFSPAPAGYSAYEIHIDTGDNHLGASWTPSDGGPSDYMDVTFPDQLAAWHDVKLVVDLTTSAVQAYLDGALVAQMTTPTLSPAAFNLQVGVVSGTNDALTPVDAKVHVDNVLVDTVP
ncbi:MAG TPA: LamG-like jellyroll fold domain-containing protein [Polyangiaceae bacterium]|jgi:hypothetical protein